MEEAVDHWRQPVEAFWPLKAVVKEQFQLDSLWKDEEELEEEYVQALPWSWSSC